MAPSKPKLGWHYAEFRYYIIDQPPIYRDVIFHKREHLPWWATRYDQYWFHRSEE